MSLCAILDVLHVLSNSHPTTQRDLAKMLRPAICHAVDNNMRFRLAKATHCRLWTALRMDMTPAQLLPPSLS